MFSLFRRRPRGARPDEPAQEAADFTPSARAGTAPLRYLDPLTFDEVPVTMEAAAKIVALDYRRRQRG